MSISKLQSLLKEKRSNYELALVHGEVSFKSLVLEMTLLVTDHDRDEQNLVSPNFADDDGGHNQTMSNFLQKIRQASLDVRATLSRQKSVTDDCVDDYEELTTVDTNDDDDDKDETVTRRHRLCC